MQLVHVQVFFRHGARTPLHHVRSPAVAEAFWHPEIADDIPHTVFPIKVLDICSNKSIPTSEIPTLPPPLKLPGGLKTGQLIKFGQEEAYDLGKRLKKVYMEQHAFISEQMSLDEILCRSTRILRTVLSLRCVLAGLFGGCLSMQRSRDEFQLPVYTETLTREFLFPNHHTCEAIKQLAVDGAKERNDSPKHLELKQKLRKILGVETLLDDFRPSSTDCPIYFVRDDYLARQRAGFPIPPGLDDVFSAMDRLSCEELLWEFLGRRDEWDQNIFVAIGSVLHMILFNMKNYNRISKFHLYSCHDSTLLLLLYALGCFDGYWPPFCSDLIFELYLDKNQLTKNDEEALENSDASPPLDALWIRVLYLGKVQPLGCLWKAKYSDAERYNAGYVPLSQLLERWNPAVKDGHLD